MVSFVRSLGESRGASPVSVELRNLTPVVVDGVMYVTTVNEAYALDARNGRQIWRYRRPRSKDLAGDAAGGINRGVAMLDDRLFMVTDNAHLIALDRITGRLLWDVEMADSKQNYGATSAPLIVKDLVVSGDSGPSPRRKIRQPLRGAACSRRRAGWSSSAAMTTRLARWTRRPASRCGVFRPINYGRRRR